MQPLFLAVTLRCLLPVFKVQNSNEICLNISSKSIWIWLETIPWIFFFLCLSSPPFFPCNYREFRNLKLNSFWNWGLLRHIVLVWNCYLVQKYTFKKIHIGPLLIIAGSLPWRRLPLFAYRRVFWRVQLFSLRTSAEVAWRVLGSLIHYSYVLVCSGCLVSSSGLELSLYKGSPKGVPCPCLWTTCTHACWCVRSSLQLKGHARQSTFLFNQQICSLNLQKIAFATIS